MSKNRDALGRVISDILTTENGFLIENKYEYLQYDDNAIDFVKKHIVNVKNKEADITNYKYDVSGNIILEERGKFKTKYSYDKLNRLIREDNSRLQKTFTFKYDNGGNIIQKKEYEYSLEDELTGGMVTNYTYEFYEWNDQLIKFGDNAFNYDRMGRPKSIEGNLCNWDHYGMLIAFGDNHYTYNLNGIRDSKNDIRFALSGNKILAEITQDGQIKIKYEYMMEKLIGFEYNNSKYFYERNIQGDILKIYREEDVSLVAEYVYDAWGNHEVINYTEDKIGNINPFRYRGYYYDTETGLYYCNSRYYNPKWGRWISPDSIEYLDPQSINGLNLYAYCGNNPVMYTDPSGYLFISILVGFVAGAIVGAAYGAVTAKANGQNVIAGMLIGGIAGALFGAVSAAGAAFMAPLLTGASALIPALSASASFAIGLSGTVVLSFGIGFGADVVTQLANNGWDTKKIDYGSAAINGIQWSILNTLTALTGGLAPGLTGGTEFLLDTMLNLLYGGIGICADVIRFHIPSNKNSRKMLLA